eukprot:756756-Hanusia_phi.AAC.2
METDKRKAEVCLNCLPLHTVIRRRLRGGGLKGKEGRGGGAMGAQEKGVASYETLRRFLLVPEG